MEATASDGTPAATASDVTPASMVRLMCAEREIKDFRRWECPKTLHDYVLDCTKLQDEVIGSVGTTVLRRVDCVGLVTNCKLEATVANCCLSLICHLAGQKGLDVLAVDSYVLACWSPPHCIDPFESLPMQHLKDCILFPTWTPGHWHFMIATKLVAGNWQLIKNKDIPSQRDSLDCGEFMLMTDVPYIREFWLNLVLKCMSHKREASRSIKWTTCMVVPWSMGFLRYNVRVTRNCTF